MERTKWRKQEVEGRREEGVGRTKRRKQVEGGREEGVGRTEGLTKMMIIRPRLTA